MASVHVVTDQHPRLTIDLVHYATNVWTPELQDPDNPRCCPLCFSLYVRVIFSPESKPQLDILLVDCHDFFGACTRMLSAPRHADDLPRLQRLLEGTVARCPNTAWHEYTKEHVGRELESVVFSLYRCLTHVIGAGPRPVKRTSTFVRKSRKGRWPVAVEQLLPHGVHDSLWAHAIWCHTLICLLSFMFLQKLLEIACPTILPALLNDSHREILMDSVLTVMRMPFPQFGQAQRLPLDAYQNMAAAAWLSDPHNGVVDIAVRFIHTFVSGPDAHMDDIFRFHAGYERVLFETLIAVADGGIRRDNSTRDSVAAMASSLHGFLHLGGSQLHPVIVAYRERVLPVASPSLNQRYTPGYFTSVVLSQYAQLRICGGPGCSQRATATGPDEPGKLRACSRCNFMQYCSRGCQQRDWRDAAGGERTCHKALCPILCKMWAAGCSLQNQRTKEFSATFERADISPSEFQIIHNCASTSAALPDAMRAMILGNVRH
ncbi:hypothetical protein AURDEDRAFT_140521 [Auricularia subglabra TFB-10046 SS5]|uniref:MYND-type domain-containing protein n=1 Tax=Auricularia subglabra (strain TFB-10046 / SS5) TaxID=717982 RepID=J0WRT9_AURST|nr:hypothetical protein AURDEDRAFT_140521 [Auricularia subglabra TFB-10046 SS5]